MAELLKDRYFQPVFFNNLTEALQKAYDAFDASKFNQLLSELTHPNLT